MDYSVGILVLVSTLHALLFLCMSGANYCTIRNSNVHVYVCSLITREREKRLFPNFQGSSRDIRRHRNSHKHGSIGVGCLAGYSLVGMQASRLWSLKRDHPYSYASKVAISQIHTCATFLLAVSVSVA